MIKNVMSKNKFKKKANENYEISYSNLQELFTVILTKNHFFLPHTANIS